MSDKHLIVEGLSIEFGGQTVVRDVSFTLAPGKTLALVGESGCGKSTTALALMALLPDNARLGGQVLFEGRDLLVSASLDLVRSIYPPETGIRLVGVTVSNFDTAARDDPQDLPLFDAATS